MPLANRILQVTFDMPNGRQVILDQDINLSVRINKQCNVIQNRCTIEVSNLTQTLRETLVSQFTAYRARLVQEGIQTQYWISVTVAAGYQTSDAEIIPTVIFKGEVASVRLTSPPPDVSVSIICYTRQQDKTNLAIKDRPPDLMSFKEFAEWVANELQLSLRFFSTRGNVPIPNPGNGRFTYISLLYILSAYNGTDVMVFVDDDMLIVKDRDTLLGGDQPVITQFIGIPMWNEDGVEFQTLFDPTIIMGNGVHLVSQMNPTVNTLYVVGALDYDLASRAESFYVKAIGWPTYLSILPPIETPT